jgi:hypothetical protein
VRREPKVRRTFGSGDMDPALQSSFRQNRIAEFLAAHPGKFLEYLAEIIRIGKPDSFGYLVDAQVCFLKQFLRFLDAVFGQMRVEINAGFLLENKGQITVAYLRVFRRIGKRNIFGVVLLDKGNALFYDK